MLARVRREPFGWAVAFERPEMLVLLGRRDLEPARPEPAAPYEAHLTLSHRCRENCPGCYIDARPDGEAELDFEKWLRVLERLAGLGIFHLALGAGEEQDLRPMIALGRRARQLGLTPNLSTAASQITPELAKELKVFERVHLSLDGLKGPRWLALKILRAFHPRVGVNLVLTAQNLDDFPRIMSRLSRERVRTVELLRFKPAGRGAKNYQLLAPRSEQLDGLVKKALRFALRYFINVRLDCSLTPFVCQGGWRPELLASLGIAGCVGGSWFLSIDGRGRLCGCSFAHGLDDPSWENIGRTDVAAPFRAFLKDPPLPCRECAYLFLCRGGCRVVARQLSGDFLAPDPHCPRVRKHRQTMLEPACR
jgi:radical SAM protein with 4Fe4S-binding SPASM domain